MDIEEKGSNLQVSTSLIMQISNFHSQTHPHQSVDYLTPVFFFFFCPWISENVFIWYRILGKNCFPSDIWRPYCIPVLIDPSYLIIVIAWLFVDDISFLSGSVYNLPFVLYALKSQKDVQLWIFFISPFSVLVFPGGSDGKESASNAGDLGLIPALWRSPGEGHGNPLQYSCLENPHEQRSLAGYRPWDPKESDMTEHLSTAFLSSNAEVCSSFVSGSNVKILDDRSVFPSYPYLDLCCLIIYKPNYLSFLLIACSFYSSGVHTRWLQWKLSLEKKGWEIHHSH